MIVIASGASGRKIIRHRDKASQTPRDLPLIAAAGSREQVRDLSLATGARIAATPPADGLYLLLETDGLALCRAGRPPVKLRVDFLTGAQGYRRRTQGRQREQVVRACAASGARAPTIVDATAGLGRDAFVLASHGASVTLLERSAIMVALLRDGLERARRGGLSEVVQRIRLIHADSVDWLQTLAPAEHPAVVYLDPMYGGTQRRAAAGKALALLQTLLGPDTDADALLPVALATARERVVVKRHRHAAPLHGRAPGHALQGRSTRFDIYPVSAATRADDAEC